MSGWESVPAFVILSIHLTRFLSPRHCAHTEITRFKVGDRVAVTMDVENFRLLQNDYGGWEAQMSLVRSSHVISRAFQHNLKATLITPEPLHMQIFGNVGIVQKLLPSGGLMVHYKVANATWQLNPTAVEKVSHTKGMSKLTPVV